MAFKDFVTYMNSLDFDLRVNSFLVEGLVCKLIMKLLALIIIILLGGKINN